MKPILEIRGISKKYRIEGNKQAYLSLRESLFSFLSPKNNKKEFWALKDISFDLMPGDTLGIIGKNGAGKSTLLKILSKITPPTTGSIIARGRIASLLEVGTGFHSELSGRENIYMNGSILGMRRKEIEKNFEAIVEFSGVEKFIDTPLKHYSSGMQLRLAFAVAAFLENEILIIDEVLAVGDAAFQKKCLTQMEQVSKDGRTIIFVSHSMNLVSSICKQALMLQAGEMKMFDRSDKVISAYIKGLSEAEHLTEDLSIYSNENISLKNITILNAEGQEGNALVFSEKWKIRIEFETHLPYKHFITAVSLRNFYDVIVRTSWSKAQEINSGKYQIEFYSDDILLEEGSYYVSLGFSDYERALLSVPDICSIQVVCDSTMANYNILRSSGNGTVLNQMRSQLIPS